MALARVRTRKLLEEVRDKELTKNDETYESETEWSDAMHWVDYMDSQQNRQRDRMTGGTAQRRCVHSILLSKPFDSIAVAVIIANLFAAVSEANLRAGGQAVPGWLELGGMLFLAFYVLELALKLFAWRWTFFEEAGNRADCFVVVADVFATLLELVLPNSGGVASLSVVRILRLLRLVRLLRAFKIFRRSRELSVMLAGMAGTFRAIFYGLVLVFGMLILWSIVAVEVLHPLTLELARDELFDDERATIAYSSVAKAFLTLLQQVVIADDWSTICTPLMERFPLTAGPILISVFVTTQLGLLNLVLTAIVDSAQEYRTLENEKANLERSKEFRKTKAELIKTCAEVDKDCSGTLELHELLEGYDSNPKFREALNIIDVQRDDIVTLYSVLDANNDGSVEYMEFLNQLHSIKMQDTNTMLVFIKSELLTLQRTLEGLLHAMQQDAPDSPAASMERMVSRIEAGISLMTSAVSPEKAGSNKWISAKQTSGHEWVSAEQTSGQERDAAPSTASIAPSSVAVEAAEDKDIPLGKKAGLVSVQNGSLLPKHTHMPLKL